MSENSRAIVPLGQRGIVASVNRQFAITEKLVGSIQSAQNLLDVFNVPQDGSFEDAIAKIRPDGLITISAGRYILEAGVTITKPLRIKGAGRDETIIETSVEGTIIRVNTDGLFELAHIGILRTGEQSGDLLSISAQEALVKQCSLTGNRNESGNDDYWWGGVRITGNTAGLVDFTSVVCCGIGIIVEGNAEIKLIFNKCVENEISGIYFSESAIGIADNNICNRNNGCGILGSNNSKVNLIGNCCNSNDISGIWFGETASGKAEKNICRQNKSSGITVEEHSNVILNGNTCEENETSGISFWETVVGTAENNICRKNMSSGITAWEHCNVYLNGNICDENQDYGISYRESAIGKVENNICRLNKKKGILIELDNADTVILNNNVCKENGE